MGSGILVLNQPGVYLVDADGNVITLGDGDAIGSAEALLIAGKDGTVARFMGVDSNGKMAVQNPPNLDAALSTLATEAKLETVRALLSTIDADTSNLDVALSTRATEATVATLATEAKLEAVRVLLYSIDGKDFATQTTLAALRTDFNAEDFATQVTLAALLSAFNAEDFASETTLASIKDTDGIKKITDALPVGDNWIGKTKVGDGTTTAGMVSDRLKTESLAAPGGATQKVQITDAGDTNLAAVVDIDGVYHVAAGKTNKVDATNSTVAQLGISGTFAPAGGTDVSQYSSVAVTVHSDEDSTVDGMIFEFSQNSTDWDDKYAFNLDASQSQTRRFQFPVTAKYFRVNYTNGGVATTAFRIQTILHRENILTSIHRVEDVVHEDRSALLVKGVIIAQREGAALQDFYPVQADVSGNLKVTTVGSDIPADPSAFVLVFLENGGSENLRVDGSTTPVAFESGPTITDEVWSIRELLLTFTADDFTFDGLSFGPITALTNGFKIEIVKSAVATEVFRVKQNEDFLRVPGRTPLVNNTGPKDVLGAALSFQGLVLNQATGDLVRVTVQDNLTSVKLKYLTATLFAVKVV